MTHIELEILFHLLEGKPTKEIARIVRRAEITVKQYLTQFYFEAGVKNRTQLALAWRRG